MIEPYYRKKGKKIIIEGKEPGTNKTVYYKTLPDANVMLNILRQDAKGPKASLNEAETDKKGPETFAQEILSEPTEDEVKRTLWEISK